MAPYKPQHYFDLLPAELRQIIFDQLPQLTQCLIRSLDYPLYRIFNKVYKPRVKRPARKGLIIPLGAKQITYRQLDNKKSPRLCSLLDRDKPYMAHGYKQILSYITCWPSTPVYETSIIESFIKIMRRNSIYRKYIHNNNRLTESLSMYTGLYMLIMYCNDKELCYKFLLAMRGFNSQYGLYDTITTCYRYYSDKVTSRVIQLIHKLFNIPYVCGRISLDNILVIPSLFAMDAFFPDDKFRMLFRPSMRNMIIDYCYSLVRECDTDLVLESPHEYSPSYLDAIYTMWDNKLFQEYIINYRDIMHRKYGMCNEYPSEYKTIYIIYVWYRSIIHKATQILKKSKIIENPLNLMILMKQDRFILDMWYTNMADYCDIVLDFEYDNINIDSELPDDPIYNCHKILSVSIVNNNKRRFK